MEALKLPLSSLTSSKVVKPVSVKKSDIPTNTLKLIEEAEKVIKSKMQSG